MAKFCEKCGQQIADGMSSCPFCGYSDAPRSTQPQYQQPQYQQPQYQQPQYQQPQYQQPQYQQPQYQQPQYQQPQYQQPQYQQPQYQQPQYQPNRQAPYQYYAAPVKKPKIPGRGFGITSMVLGIVGTVISISVLFRTIKFDSYARQKIFKGISFSGVKNGFIEDFMLLGVLAVLSIVFALVAIYSKKYRKGQSLAGLVLGIATAVLTITAVVIFVVYLSSNNGFINTSVGDLFR